MDRAPGETRSWTALRRGTRPADGSVFRRSGVRGLLALELSFMPLAGGGMPVPLVAASASEAIRKDTGVISWLQWPDLVSIEGKAVGRAAVSKGPTGLTTAEITINCHAPLESMRPEGMQPTSIRETLGVEIDVDLLREKLVHAFDWYLAEWERGMHRKMIDRIQPTIPWVGSVVEVLSDAGKARGTASGLGEGCALVVARGRIRTAFMPEEVRFVRPVG